jgi:hypothetical protein
MQQNVGEKTMAIEKNHSLERRKNCCRKNACQKKKKKEEKLVRENDLEKTVTLPHAPRYLVAVCYTVKILSPEPLERRRKLCRTCATITSRLNTGLVTPAPAPAPAPPPPPPSSSSSSVEGQGGKTGGRETSLLKAAWWISFPPPPFQIRHPHMAPEICPSQTRPMSLASVIEFRLEGQKGGEKLSFRPRLASMVSRNRARWYILCRCSHWQCHRRDQRAPSHPSLFISATATSVLRVHTGLRCSC